MPYTSWRKKYLIFIIFLDCSELCMVIEINKTFIFQKILVVRIMEMGPKTVKYGKIVFFFYFF